MYGNELIGIDEGLIKKGDEKYNLSYTEIDQSIKYIKNKIKNKA